MKKPRIEGMDLFISLLGIGIQGCRLGPAVAKLRVRVEGSRDTGGAGSYLASSSCSSNYLVALFCRGQVAERWAFRANKLF